MLAVLIDATTIRKAIRDGFPDKVEDLFAQMNDTEVINGLTRPYGRGVDVPDDDDLYEGTTPILHAARSGKADMFSFIYRVMRSKLSSQKVYISKLPR